MTSHQDRTCERIYELLRGGYRSLFESASRRGHWSEIRSTALATICLNLREDADSLWIQTLRKWMVGRQEPQGPCNGCWGEEVWDTAMAVYALKDLEISSKDKCIVDAVRWLTEVYTHNGRFNWHDEPWETSWALMAILRCGTIPPEIDVARSIRWLSSMQAPNGMIVSPHYTAYFILICMHADKVNLADAVQEEIQVVARKCRACLMELLETAPASHLWMNEAWANGQILWALCEEGDGISANPQLVEKVLAWFELKQRPDGSFADVEDTASAIIGLSKLLECMISQCGGVNRREGLREMELRLRRAVPVPRLLVERPWFARDDEADYYTINIPNRTGKLLATAASVIFVGLIGWISSILGVWQFFHE